MRLISWLAVENLFNLAHSHFRNKSSLCTAQLDGSISDTKSRGEWFFRGQKFFEFFLCVFVTMKTVFQWTSWTLVEAQRIKASNWKAQNITFLLTLLWVTAYTRCVAGSWRFLPPVGLSLTPLILVLLARPFIGVITLQHSVVCLLCKLAGVNSCYLPDPFKVLCFSMCCCTDSDPTISLIL